MTLPRLRDLRCILRCNLSLVSFSRNCLTRTPIMRLSNSNCFSPGPPRTPIPPFWRSKWVQPRTNLVDKCSSCASSTCSLPSWLFARCAKISRIKPVLSSTLACKKRSKLRCCDGLKSWLNATKLVSLASSISFNSSALPLPINNFASGVLRLPSMVARTCIPAEVTNWRSSCRLSE